MSDSRWSALLFASAFLPRLVSWLGSAIFGTDGCHYLLMADWMREGRFQDALSLAYHPLYPMLIAVFRTVTPTTELAGGALSVLLGSAAVLPLHRMTLAVFGRPASVLACLLYAFHPALVEVQSDVMTEGAFLFFLFASMALTWKVMEAPSLELGAVLGATAGAAFLTRPEGLLAIGLGILWPLVDVLRRREAPWKRLGTLIVAVAALVLVVSPYLLWVKSERSRWALSVRPSAIAAEKSAGIPDPSTDPEDTTGDPTKESLYRTYAASLLRLSLGGLLVPFYVVGFAALKNVGRRAALFYLSYPLGQFVGILLALRTHTFMSDRYLMAGMAWMGGIAALGMVATIRAAARRWPEPRCVRVACVALLLVLGVPVLRYLKPRRVEMRSYPGSARWIRERHAGPVALSGLEQVSYYCGTRSYYLPKTPDGLEAFLKHQPLDYIVYSERDVRNRPGYVAMLRSSSRLEAPLEYAGEAGTWNVYFLRVR